MKGVFVFYIFISIITFSIHSPHFSSRSKAIRNFRLENVIARREGERELQNRSSVVIPMKFSRPTFPPTNRSGEQVDGKERHRITRLILPLLLLFTVTSTTSFSSSYLLVSLLSPPSPS